MHHYIEELLEASLTGTQKQGKATLADIKARYDGTCHASVPHSELENQQTQKLRLKDTHTYVWSHTSSV